jgi:tetratricopeptide (TPR) repeat protein
LQADAFSASLQKAIKLHQTGRYDEAKEVYEFLLLQNAKHPDVLNLYGLLCFEVGNTERAVDLVRRAIAQSPSNAEFLNNLGSIFASEAKFELAIEQFQKAVKAEPSQAMAYENLGNALMESGMAKEAIEPFQKYVDLAPDDYNGYIKLAGALNASGQPDKAVSCLRGLLEDGNDNAVVWNNLGVMLQESGDINEAISAFEKSIATNPQYAAAYANLATACLENKDLDHAESFARESLKLEPGLQTACTALGLVLLAKGNIRDAAQFILEPSLNFRDRQAENDPYLGAFNHINAYKIEHDIAQLEHLMGKGILDSSYRKLIDEYRALTSSVRDDGQIINLSDLKNLPSNRFLDCYNRLLNFYDAPIIDGGVINPDLDCKAIEKAYHQHQPGFACVDNFLTKQAITELRRFCLESTVWYDMSAIGDLGANLEDGFCCPLLLQIANEIRERFPSIYGEHYFSTCWSYRYYAKKSGDGLHGDSGRVSVNIWITPDEANRNPDGGGLLFWNKKVPMLKVKDNPKEMTDQIMRDIIAEPDAEYFSVPYGCNRAALFNSNIIHKTDEIDFIDGYENRRLNITFVFGKPDY